jgi:hypothetical protein
MNHRGTEATERHGAARLNPNKKMLWTPMLEIPPCLSVASVPLWFNG